MISIHSKFHVGRASQKRDIWGHTGKAFMKYIISLLLSTSFKESSKNCSTLLNELTFTFCTIHYNYFNRNKSAYFRNPEPWFWAGTAIAPHISCPTLACVITSLSYNWSRLFSLLLAWLSCLPFAISMTAYHYYQRTCRLHLAKWFST